MNNFFQIYNNSTPELNEIVLIKFIKKNDYNFEGELIEYNYKTTMSYNNATKKKKVTNWNNIVPLNKVILAKIEIINIENMCVEVSMAYNDNKIDIKEQLKPFLDTKILLSLIKKISYINKIDFDEFWKSIIHPIDKIRKEEYDEENNLFIYFKNENTQTLLTELIKDKYENHINILISINNNIFFSNKKITSKIGIVTTDNINNVKEIISNFTKNLDWIDYSFKYDSTPYYILESYTNNSVIEQHDNFINTLHSLFLKNNIFSKIEYIGKI